VPPISAQIVFSTIFSSAATSGSMPRQVGKTTLAHAVARRLGRAVYPDLERPSDSARLADPELYLEPLADRLVIIDEIQRAPALFPVLRGP
jgi:predicted AAA+ superfamily ATPase